MTQHLNDSQLLVEIKAAVLDGRKAATKVLHLLKQVENRKLYAEKGFPSLFAFAVDFLGYSESAAGRRISAMRLLKEIPELENKILSGELNLSSISQAQSHFRNEAAELIKTMTEFCLDKVDPLRKKPNSLPTSGVEKFSKQLSVPANCNPMPVNGLPDFPLPSRYIPVNIKHEVWKRDQGKCQFVDKSTGLVCESQRLIQIDHQHPWALGGDHAPENLQLLCATHNKFRHLKFLDGFNLFLEGKD